MIPYLSVNFFSFPNEANSVINLLDTPPKIKGIILVNFENFAMNFSLNQFSKLAQGLAFFLKTKSLKPIFFYRNCF